MTRTIRVVTADDQTVVREGLSLVLGLLPGVEVVGAASDGEQAVSLARELAPDVVLMDLRMPHVDGVEATRRLRRQQPDVKVVVLTTYADDASVVDALRAGAHGYLTKDASAADIESALHRVLEEQAVIDPAVQHHVVAALSSASQTASGPGGTEPLTAREGEVLALVAQGMSNAEVAAALVVSEATVKSHMHHILTKIDARDRAQAVSYAYRHGLIRG